jgi:hypothetical protein
MVTKFYISFSAEDDFGKVNTASFYQTVQVWQTRNVRGIAEMRGAEAILEPDCISWTAWWKPVEKILNIGKRIEEISDEEFIKALEVFGNCEVDHSHSYPYPQMKFDSMNPYDLSFCKKEGDRILINYKNCPINSFYCIQDKNEIKIIISTFNKSYYTMEEYEWTSFLDYIESDKADMRDAKINSLLDDKSEGIDCIRQAKFLVKSRKINHKYSQFVSNVLEYYDRNGSITPKQEAALIKVISN